MAEPSTPDGNSRGQATPLRGGDARLAANMVASLAVPTATSFREIDVARLVTERARFNAALAPRKLSFTHFLAYAVAQAAASERALAAHYEERDEAPFRVDPASISLGLAVDVLRPDGSRFLVVPVLRAADALDFAAFSAAYDDLIERARAGRLKVDEMAGADLTLTNPGSLGTFASVPRLMPGQGAIIATGALRREGDKARIMVSSTYDHRIITGAQSALFLAALEDFLGGADGFYEDAGTALGVPPGSTPSAPPSAPAPGSSAGLSEAPPSDTVASPALTAVGVTRRDVAAAAELLDAWRIFGHRAAALDPLGSARVPEPALDPATYGLDEDTLAAIDATALGGRPGESAGQVLAGLRHIYGGAIAYEFEHLDRHAERAWLREAVEHGTYATPLGSAAQRRILARLTEAEAFEQFLGRAYLGQTRFSLEGLDTLLPLLDELAEQAAAAGVREFELGMAHRGRLNVLAHFIGMPYAAIMAEFGADDALLEAADKPSDVRYHRGARGVRPTAAGPLPVQVLPNPSHLEAIDPVLLGWTRALQT
jgi:2-oxoglutarate decarboxylase